jgi:ADP-heptose:LPS heptosyltransferase
MKVINSTIKIFVLFFYYFLDNILPLRHKITKSDDFNNALIVRIDNIGDFIIWKNSAQILIDTLHLQGYKVTLLVNSIWADFADISLNVDNIVEINRRKIVKDIFYWLKIRKILFDGNFKLAISPVFSREFLKSDFLIRMSRASHKIGIIGDLANSNCLEKFLSDRFYTQLIDIPELIKHDLNKNKYFLNALNIKSEYNLRPSLNFTAPLSNEITFPRNYVVMGVGGSFIEKKWPIERFQILSNWLADKYNLTTVIIGNKEDIEIKLSSNWGNIINLCGKTTLLELPSIVKKAKLVISNDTSLIHFAFSAGVNAVCILGGGQFGRFLPYPDNINDDKPIPKAVFSYLECFGCDWKCCYPKTQQNNYLCIDKVTVDMVKKEILGIMVSKY